MESEESCVELCSQEASALLMSGHFGLTSTKCANVNFLRRRPNDDRASPKCIANGTFLHCRPQTVMRPLRTHFCDVVALTFVTHDASDQCDPGPWIFVTRDASGVPPAPGFS